MVFPDGLSGKTVGAASVTGAPLGGGLCTASNLQHVGNGGGGRVNPPIQLLG